VLILLDTCTLVYDALTPSRLSAAAFQAIEEANQDGHLACSDITLWEIAMLIAHRRIDPGTDAATFIRLALDARGITVLPITPEIAHRSAVLNLHGDPAGRLIAATAIEHGATLLTPDRMLRESNLVTTLW
jgi:PIN domain nuclease of toxin-antitoxin system